MEVVREHAKRVDLDVEALRRDREDIEKDVVRRLARSEEELALGAASGDEVGGSGENLARGGHALRAWQGACLRGYAIRRGFPPVAVRAAVAWAETRNSRRSEEHTSELQSRR